MPSFARILVPVDFSASSEAALSYALAIGRRFESIVDVLHVFQTSTVVPVTSARGAAKEALKSFVARTKIYGTIELRRRVEYGDPFLTILNLATSGVYSLIVQGTHGKNELSARQLGHVTESLMGASPCPLALVPHVEGSTREWWPEGGETERRGVLVPIDARGATRAAIQWAASLASRLQVDLEPLFIDEGRDPRETQEQKELLAISLRSIEGGGPAVKERLEQGDLRNVVLRLAAERRHDALVMGVDRLAGALHGANDDLSEELVRKKLCPVILVPGG